MRYFLPILLFLSTVLVGCIPDDNNSVVSSDARVSTFTFVKDTLNPGLTDVVYKIEHRSDTGLITCRDSLRFGTRLDSVIPLVTYMATPGKVEFVLNIGKEMHRGLRFCVIIKSSSKNICYLLTIYNLLCRL